MDWTCEKMEVKLSKLCLICGSSHQGQDEDGHGRDDEEIQSSSSIIYSSVKLLTAYILQNSLLSSKSCSERNCGKNEIQSEILSSFRNGKCSICGECLTRAGNLLELHLELEKLQMQILDVLKNLQDYLKSKIVRRNDDHLHARFQDVLEQEFLCREFWDGTQVRLERLHVAGYDYNRASSSFHNLPEAEADNSMEYDERHLRLKMKRTESNSSVDTEQEIMDPCVDEYDIYNDDDDDDDDYCPEVEDKDAEEGGDGSDSDSHHYDNQDQDKDDTKAKIKPRRHVKAKGRKRGIQSTHRDCDICLEMIPSKEMKSHLQSHPEFERFYECDICPPDNSKKRIYGTYKGLVWHYLRAKHKVQLPCQLCPDQSILFLRSKLCRHLYEFHHLNHKRLPCIDENCPEEFYDHVTRRAHFYREHCGAPDNQIQCPSCPKIFKTRRAFRLHEKTHEEGYNPEMMKMKCPQCSKMISKYRLQRHIISVHSVKVEVEREFICDLCQRRPKFKTEARLQLHIDRIHGEGDDGTSFSCASCPKAFKSRTGLRIHEKTFHEEPDMVMCSQCPKTFQRLKLAGHIWTVHGEKKKKKKPEERLHCQYCSQTFTKLCILKAHEEVHRNEKKYKCEEPECPYAGNTKMALTNHRRCHRKEKTYKCQFCPKMFALKQYKINHERTHRKSEEVKALQCQYCPKTFSLPYLLKSHEEAHRNDRKYLCTKCPFAGKTRRALIAHKICHRDKTLKCQFCPMMFAVKRTLKNHESTHSKVKIFKCDLCKEAFNTLDKRFRHRKKLHPEFVVNRNLAGVGILNQEEKDPV